MAVEGIMCIIKRGSFNMLKERKGRDEAELTIRSVVGGLVES